MEGDYGITMALGYAWFDTYDCIGYVVTLHISPHTDCPYLPIDQIAVIAHTLVNHSCSYPMTVDSVLGRK
eukprot:COSAG05_NODE_2175_length_3437_cov_25.916417_2_plen_70_part_00